MFLDDLVEGGEDGRDGVVRGSHVALRVPARQLLHQVSHRVFPCKERKVLERDLGRNVKFLCFNPTQIYVLGFHSGFVVKCVYSAINSFQFHYNIWNQTRITSLEEVVSALLWHLPD